MPKEKSEAEWMAENDADCLARASDILGDDKRLKAAQKAAVNMAKEIADRLESILTIAGKGKTFEGMKIIKPN